MNYHGNAFYIIYLQKLFQVGKYMEDSKELTPGMRAILIDWLVEVQENFELYHETLYLAVRIVDLYLQKKETEKQNLQLVGATAMLIAAKIEVFTAELCLLISI